MLPNTENILLKLLKASLVMNEPPQCETFANGVANEPNFLRQTIKTVRFISTEGVLPDPKNGQVRKERSFVASG